MAKRKIPQTIKECNTEMERPGTQKTLQCIVHKYRHIKCSFLYNTLQGLSCELNQIFFK